MAERIVSLQTVSAAPLTVGRLTVTPQSQVLSVRLPFARFVWHRPTGVLVERNGRAERIRILDFTRIAQVVFIAVVVAAAVVGLGSKARRGRSTA